MLQFEWDTKKSSLNKRKHGVSFELASLIFHDPWLVSIPDHRYYYGEERWQSLGEIDGVLIYVVHTVTEEHHGKEIIRIISARAATQSEERRYYAYYQNEK